MGLDNFSVPEFFEKNFSNFSKTIFSMVFFGWNFFALLDIFFSWGLECSDYISLICLVWLIYLQVRLIHEC